MEPWKQRKELSEGSVGNSQEVKQEENREALKDACVSLRRQRTLPGITEVTR